MTSAHKPDVSLEQSVPSAKLSAAQLAPYSMASTT